LKKKKRKKEKKKNPHENNKTDIVKMQQMYRLITIEITTNKQTKLKTIC
jgi:hypothetical protein